MHQPCDRRFHAADTLYEIVCPWCFVLLSALQWKDITNSCNPQALVRHSGLSYTWRVVFYAVFFCPPSAMGRSKIVFLQVLAILVCLVHRGNCRSNYYTFTPGMQVLVRSKGVQLEFVESNNKSKVEACHFSQEHMDTLCNTLTSINCSGVMVLYISCRTPGHRLRVAEPSESLRCCNRKKHSCTWGCKLHRWLDWYREPCWLCWSKGITVNWLQVFSCIAFVGKKQIALFHTGQITSLFCLKPVIQAALIQLI